MGGVDPESRVTKPKEDTHESKETQSKSVESNNDVQKEIKICGIRSEMKRSLASALPGYLLSLIVGMLGMLEEQLQSLGNYGRALLFRSDSAAQKHVSEMLRDGQQDLSDRILHGMSSEEQLVLAFWIYSVNKSINYQSSLKQLQQSPQILILTFLVLKTVQNPQRENLNEAFHPNAVLVLVSALSSMIHNREDYEHQINLLPEPIVIEAFQLLEAEDNVCLDDLCLYFGATFCFKLFTEMEDKKCLCDMKQKCILFKKRIDKKFMKASSLMKQRRELVEERRDDAQQHTSPDSIGTEKGIKGKGKGKSSLPKRQCQNAEAANNAETYCKSTRIRKYGIETQIHKEEDSEASGTNNAPTEVQSEMSSSDQPASPPSWCWKKRIRHLKVQDFIRKSSQKLLKELDTECHETICHAIVCEFDTNSAVTLVSELKKRFKKRSHRFFHHCDNLGNTPLHNAVRRGNVLIVQKLLSLCPSSLHIQNNDLATPIDIAMHENHHQIVEYLLHSAVERDPCGSCSMLQSCLLNAMKIGYTEYLRIVLQLQSKHNLAIDFDCTDRDKHTAWFYLKQKDSHVHNTAWEIIMSSACGSTLLGKVLSNNSFPSYNPPSKIPSPRLPCSSSFVPQDESVVALPQYDNSPKESESLNVLSNSTCVPPIDGSSVSVNRALTDSVEECEKVDDVDDDDEWVHKSSQIPCSNSHSSESDSPASSIESTVSTHVKPVSLPLNTECSREQDVTSQTPTPETPVRGRTCVVPGMETQEVIAVVVKDRMLDHSLEGNHLPTDATAVNTDLECSATDIQEIPQPGERLDDSVGGVLLSSESQPSSPCSDASSLDLQPAPPDIAVTQAVTSGLDYSSTEESDSSSQAGCIISQFTDSVTSSGHSTPEKRIKGGNKQQRQQAEIRLLRHRLPESESSESEMVCPRRKKNSDNEKRKSDSEPGTSTRVSTEASSTISSDSESCEVNNSTSNHSTADVSTSKTECLSKDNQGQSTTDLPPRDEHMELSQQPNGKLAQLMKIEGSVMTQQKCTEIIWHVYCGSVQIHADPKYVCSDHFIYHLPLYLIHVCQCTDSLTSTPQNGGNKQQIEQAEIQATSESGLNENGMVCPCRKKYTCSIVDDNEVSNIDSEPSTVTHASSAVLSDCKSCGINNIEFSTAGGRTDYTDEEEKGVNNGICESWQEPVRGQATMGAVVAIAGFCGVQVAAKRLISSQKLQMFMHDVIISVKLHYMNLVQFIGDASEKLTLPQGICDEHESNNSYHISKHSLNINGSKVVMTTTHLSVPMLQSLGQVILISQVNDQNFSRMRSSVIMQQNCTKISRANCQDVLKSAYNELDGCLYMHVPLCYAGCVKPQFVDSMTSFGNSTPEKTINNKQQRQQAEIQLRMRRVLTSESESSESGKVCHYQKLSDYEWSGVNNTTDYSTTDGRTDKQEQGAIDGLQLFSPEPGRGLALNNKSVMPNHPSIHKLKQLKVKLTSQVNINGKSAQAMSFVMSQQKCTECTVAPPRDDCMGLESRQLPKQNEKCAQLIVVNYDFNFDEVLHNLPVLPSSHTAEKPVLSNHEALQSKQELDRRGWATMKKPMILNALTTLTEQRSVMLQRLIDAARTIKQLYLTRPNLILPCNVIPLNQGPNNILVSRLTDYSSAKFSQVATASHEQLSYAEPEAVTVSQQCSWSVSWTIDVCPMSFRVHPIQQWTDNEAASVRTGIASGTFTNSFDKKHFKKWILTTIQNGGYDRLRYSVHSSWHSVFGFVPVKGKPLTRSQKKRAKVVLSVARSKKSSIPEYVLQNLRDLSTLVCRNNTIDLLDDTDDFFRGKKPKPSKKDKSKKGADGSGTVKKSPSQGSDDTGIGTATTSELDAEDGMKSSRARTLGATPCSADAPVHRQKSRVNSFPRSKNGHPLSMAPEEPSRVAMSTQISEEFYQSTAETSTRVPEEIVQASRVPTESQFEKPRQEVSVENSVLNFTNSNNSLDVIQSHLTTYSKCCPRHDIQNIVVVGTTCPASDAFGPKRRYSSIKDIKQDPRHDKFNAIKSLQEKTSFIFQHSQQVMSDRLMPQSERRARETMPHLISDTTPATNLHELHSQHRASSSTQLLTQSQGNQNIASNSKAGRDVSTELHQPKSTQHHTTPLPGVQRSSIQSVPTVSTHPHSEPGDHKDRLRCMAELLHAQDYPRLLPLSYNGRPPPSFPPKIRIPYVFIAGLAFYKMSNHKKSVEYFQQCLHLAEECNRDGDITICSIYIGDIEFAQRKYIEAADKYRTALHHYSRDSVASDFRMILPTKSAVWSKCGSAFKNASRMGDAVTAYEQAIEVASSKKDRLSAHTSLGNLYQGIGENDRAVSEYEEAIALATDLKDDVSLGWNHGNLGNALLGLHQRDKALHHLYKALDMAVDFETTPQAIGRAYNNLGTAYQSLNELKKAEEHYDLALAQAIYGNDIPGQARVYGNIGNLQMLNKQFDRAVPHYTEVMRLSQDKSTITTAHHNRGCAYYDWAEKKKKDYAQRSATNESAESNKTTFKVSLHGPNFERCEEDYRPPFVSDGIQKYYLQGTRDLEYVMRHHEENFNGIKGSPKGLSLSVSLFETNSRTFHRMQDCLVHVKKSDHQPSKFEDALLVAEQSRARTLGELLLKRRGPQLENKLESLPSLPQLKSIVERQHHPVLYLSYTGERLLGWLLVPEFEGEELKGECTLNMFEVPLSDSEFDGKSFDYHLRYSLNEQLVERSFEMYKPFKHDKDNPDPVAKLHDLVAKPVIHMLKTLKKQQSSQEKGQKSSNSEEEKRRKVEPQKIIVIPDSYTNLLPFTCTLDRDSGKFWGDDYYFQIMPSLLTMGILDQLPKVSVAIPVEHQQMLCVVGNPTIPPFKYNNDEWNLGKLPHATKEAEWVSHILKCKPILHEQATKDAVMMRIMNAKVIHLATHGSAVAGFLAFAGMTASTTDTVDAKRVLIYPEEIESLNISPALVVLSSCDSGRGVFKADGIQGMARAFILAGAQAVLTTLWRVPDESACIFMQFFYQYLVEGVKGPEALHKSILSLRCFKKYSQYIHWSGYQLTGREFQFQVNQSSARAQLTTRLGQSSIFPQLDILKSLETAFMNNPRLPTDVQVLHGPPGVKPSEPMIDFIHCHHTHFTGGIFWINCRTPQLIDASIEYIKDAMKVKKLSDLPDNESQPSLVVLDSLDQFPTECGPLLTFLKRVTVHIVIISKNVAAPDQLRKSIDRQLIRGTNTIDVQPLSTIHATQRLVHSALKNHHLAPSPKYQKVFEQLAEFTTGSPPILDLASSLLDQSLRQTEHATGDYDALENFEKQVQLDQLPKLKPLSVPKDDRHTSLSLPQPACVRNIIPEVFESIKMSDDDDVWNTSAKYDSWQVTTVLIRQCNLTPEEQLLLFCLSNFSCSPIPTAYVTEIATIITKASHQPHLASTLHTKLEDAKMLKVYPKPAVYHPTLQTHTSGSASAAAEAEFVYVPRFISAAVWKDMMTDMDKVMALGTCYKALHNIVDQSHTDIENSFLLGIGSLLVESYELNFKLVGKLCFQEVYSLFLSSHRSL